MPREANKDVRFSFLFDSQQLQQGIRDATRHLSTLEGKIGKFAAGFDKVGRSIQRNLVLPMAAVGAASLKLAIDFETSMQKVVALVGLSQQAVDSYKDGIKDMAVETGRTARELADAFFFITSAGIRGGASGDPLEVLEMSAKAAAAGMGEAKIVADALTSAINAYGVTNLSAAEATDVLVATIREGKLEAETVAGVIGKVIPIAAQLGVEFNEVGAAIATMSRIGIDADVGSTALRAMLNGILGPTADTKKAFQEFGTSAEELQIMLRDQGLLATLQFLGEHFDGNNEAAKRAFPNIRALTAALGILADNSHQANLIFGAMVDNTGDLDRAFQAMTETTQFRLNQALAALQNAGIELGASLAPTINNLAEDVTRFAQAWTGLGEGTQGAIIGIGKLVLGLGLLTVVLSKVTNLVAGFAKALPAIISASETAYLLAGGMGALVGAAGLAAGVLTAFGTSLYLGMKDAAQYASDVDTLTAAMLNASNVSGVTENLFQRAFKPQIAFSDYDSGENMEQALRKMGMSMEQAQRIIRGGLPALAEWRESLSFNVWDQDAQHAYRQVHDALARTIRLNKEAYESYRQQTNFGVHDSWMNQMQEQAKQLFEDNQMGGWLEQSIPTMSLGFRVLAARARASFVDQMEIMQEWRDRTSEIVGSVVGMFKEAPDQIKVSFGQWRTNLTEQKDAMERWKDGLLTLVEAGLGNLAQQFYDAGPASADAVQAMIRDMENAVDFENLIIEMATFTELVNLAVADALDGVTSLFESAFAGFHTLKELIEFGFRPQELFGPIGTSGLPSGAWDAPDFTRENPGRTGKRSISETDGRYGLQRQNIYIDTYNMHVNVPNDPSTSRRIIRELEADLARYARETVVE